MCGGGGPRVAAAAALLSLVLCFRVTVTPSEALTAQNFREGNGGPFGLPEHHQHYIGAGLPGNHSGLLVNGTVEHVEGVQLMSVIAALPDSILQIIVGLSIDHDASDGQDWKNCMLTAFHLESNVRIVYVKGLELTVLSNDERWKGLKVESLHRNRTNTIVFSRLAPDRQCLLTPPLVFPFKLLTSDMTVESHQCSWLVQWVNQQCFTFRSPNGELTLGGKRKEAMELYIKEMEDKASSDSREDNTTQHVPPSPNSLPTCEVIDISHTSPNTFFDNYVAKSKPVILEGATSQWIAHSSWKHMKDFEHSIGNSEVHVKVTPGEGLFEGCEPAALWGDPGGQSIPDHVAQKLQSPDQVIVRPATLDISIQELFAHMKDESMRQKASFYIEYFSIPNHLPQLLKDIQPSPADILAPFWELEELNLWLGNGNTLGKLHFDAFDNLMAPVIGTKTFTLIPPFHNEDLYEGHIREAFLEFNTSTLEFARKRLAQSTGMVFSPIDLNNLDLSRFPGAERAFSSRINCTVAPGQVLYVPAWHWHEVHSSSGSFDDITTPINLAVNYWFRPVWNKEFPCRDCRLFLNPDYRTVLQDFI